MKLSLVLVFIVAFLTLKNCTDNDEVSSPSKTKEATSNEVLILNNSAEMFKQRRLPLAYSASLGSDGIPDKVRIGDIIKVDDTLMKVGYILVTYYLEDIQDWGDYVMPKKGDITCVIVESKDDLPDDREANRVWVYAKQCKPLN